MATNGTSSSDPTATTDLYAGRTLVLGEFAHERTLNLSEARIILAKSLDSRLNKLRLTDPNAQPPRETETLAKTRDYLSIFAVFKDIADAEMAERIINGYADSGMQLEMFERSQLGSLVPSCADEAKALIPSIEKKVEDGVVGEEELEALCKDLGRLKRTTQL